MLPVELAELLWCAKLQQLCWAHREHQGVSPATWNCQCSCRSCQMMPTGVCRCQVRWNMPAMTAEESFLAWPEILILTLVELSCLSNSIQVYWILLKSIEVEFLHVCYLRRKQTHRYIQKGMCWIKCTIYYSPSPTLPPPPPPPPNYCISPISNKTEFSPSRQLNSFSAEPAI